MNLTPSQILDHNVNCFEFPKKTELTTEETNLRKRYISEYRKLKGSTKPLPFSQITQENLLREAILSIELSQKRRQIFQTLSDELETLYEFANIEEPSEIKALLRGLKASEHFALKEREASNTLKDIHIITNASSELLKKRRREIVLIQTQQDNTFTPNDTQIFSDQALIERAYREAKKAKQTKKRKWNSHSRGQGRQTRQYTRRWQSGSGYRGRGRGRGRYRGRGRGYPSHPRHRDYRNTRNDTHRTDNRPQDQRPPQNASRRGRT